MVGRGPCLQRVRCRLAGNPEESCGDRRRGAPEDPRCGGEGMSLKPWREVASPHGDVSAGRYQQAEFAADLAQVIQGRADVEYQDPSEFFARTFVTQGMRSLLVVALQRVAGLGGEPVVKLKTSFGGGKTHTMLALYHLLGRASARNLQGVPDLLR